MGTLKMQDWKMTNLG